jgi:hypothetical protein
MILLDFCAIDGIVFINMRTLITNRNSSTIQMNYPNFAASTMGWEPPLQMEENVQLQALAALLAEKLSPAHSG